ncbi:Uncharacterized conserved protein, DUF885 familyt [Sphingomonas jatrophae]|uniref:Uncharacterized conserved protein, DUF885 familyt n=1 Tax=Sphingomonas jatrophae TaxID=1166337 RepID=A0A1I6JW35_9SPHN|nr:DUF885 domain-containing protein [Sphingomonas jatrophae]SFR83167.1 Uncharacterized conserved protein, DUF885 familyt [Sphingomonas jatrophae]
MARLTPFLAALLAAAAPAVAQAPVAAPSAATTATPFARFQQEVIEAAFRESPTFGVSQGRHEFDGRLPDWSEAGLKRTAATFRALRQRAADWKGLSPKDAFGRDYTVAQLDNYLFWLEEADQPHTNPAYYLNNGLFPDLYTARTWGTPEARMRGFIAYAEALPKAATQIRANLRTPMPETFVYLGKAGFQGLADFFRGNDGRAAFSAVKDKALWARFDAATKRAGDAMAGLSAWMDEAKATQTQDFALGGERLSRMLYATERVATPVKELERIGREDLRRNQAALKQACAAYAPGASIVDCIAKEEAQKPDGGVVEAARAQLAGLRKFIEDKQLVTIPGPEQALVAEAPSYNRQNFAYIDIPGPFELGQPSTYYIAPPDPSWSKAVQEGYIPGKANLLFTSAHEVWPGHFLQFLHANRSPDLFGRVFVGYAYAEGYAHYAEEMMWDAGLGNGDPEVHIGQLSNALLRNCRYLSAIGLHTAGMTVDQSRKLFMDECYQDEGTARQQAARGTYDPAYLNYTLGKLMIRRLRDDWTKTHGGRAGWKAFHDAFLSYGGPPVPLVRSQMMGVRADAVF